MRIHLFFHTALLFVAAQWAGFVVAEQLNNLSVSRGGADGGGLLSLIYFLLFFFSVTLFLLVLFELHKGRVVYRTLFIAAAFIGILKVFELVFPFSLSLAVAALFVVGLFVIPAVGVHDLIILIASAGIGPLFGMQFMPATAALLLIVLSAYDVIAVFVTRHMAALEHAMVSHQATFAFIIPERWKLFRTPLSGVKPGTGFLILGGGDIIIPMIFSTSVFVVDPLKAAWAVAGMLGGLLVNHVLLMRQRTFLPALPFITLGAFAGYFLGGIFI